MHRRPGKQLLQIGTGKLQRLADIRTTEKQQSQAIPPECVAVPEPSCCGFPASTITSRLTRCFKNVLRPRETSSAFASHVAKPLSTITDSALKITPLSAIPPRPAQYRSTGSYASWVWQSSVSTALRHCMKVPAATGVTAAKVRRPASHCRCARHRYRSGRQCHRKSQLSRPATPATQTAPIFPFPLPIQAYIAARANAASGRDMDVL